MQQQQQRRRRRRLLVLWGEGITTTVVTTLIWLLICCITSRDINMRIVVLVVAVFGEQQQQQQITNHHSIETATTTTTAAATTVVIQPEQKESQHWTGTEPTQRPTIPPPQQPKSDGNDDDDDAMDTEFFEENDGDIILLDHDTTSSPPLMTKTTTTKKNTDRPPPTTPQNQETTTNTTNTTNATSSQNLDTTNDDSVIVIALVDGTLVGLSRTTGHTLWKQQQQQQQEQSQQQTYPHPNNNNHNQHPLVKPLVSTTTTIGNDRKNTHHHHHQQQQQRYKTLAVPSISDGKVYLTSTSEDCSRMLLNKKDEHSRLMDTDDDDDDDDDMDVFGTTDTTTTACDVVEDTVTTTIHNLMLRTPFIDMKNHGRIYTSQRHSVAVAIHSTTGTPIRTITTTTKATTTNDDDNHHHHPPPPLHKMTVPVDPVVAIHETDDTTTTTTTTTTTATPHTENNDKNDDILWLGRTDYTITVHEPITGELDVQFTMAEMMSIHDMMILHDEDRNNNNNIKPQHPSSQQRHEEQILRQYLLPHQSDQSTPEVGDDADSIAHRVVSSTTYTKSTTTPYGMIATPNGAVAYRNLYTGQILWVASETFLNTPAVYAFDSKSGHSVPVDIVPDVISPHGTMEYISHELQKQLYQHRHDTTKSGQNRHHHHHHHHHPYAGLQNEPVFGSLPGTGQIYAIPLLQKVSATMEQQPPMKPIYYDTSTTTSDGTVVGMDGNPATTANMLTTAAENVRSIPDAARAYVAGSHGTDGNHHYHQQSYSHCHPNSPHYPRCLSYLGGGSTDRYNNNNYHYHQRQFRNTFPNSLSEVSSFQYPIDGYDDTASEGSNGGGAIVPFYHPDYGYQYIPPNHFYTINTEWNEQYRRRKRYKKFIRIVTSWLIPSVVATIFVMSFELGRRKRIKSENNSDSNVVSTAGQSTESSSDVAVGIIQVNEDVILGHGGHGTVVYRGMLEGRPVAVKRLLKTYNSSADREISLLIESDGHPNVVRYHLKETRGDFVYLALELCDLSLHDLIGHIRIRLDRIGLDNAEEREKIFNATKSVLLQITKGIEHLHRLRIVHRDLKPANILLANKRSHKSNKNDNTEISIYETFARSDYVAKISDMGLGKQLAGQSSYGGSMYNDSSLRGESNGVQSSIIGIGPGSVGWQAPEVMRLRMPSDISAKSDDISYPNDTGSDFSPIDVPANQTSRSVDIFSLGCIFYSTLIPGSHPFGEWYEREGNIMHNRPNLTAIACLSLEAHDLINLMLCRDPLGRPTARHICEHPFFWTHDRRLSLLCDLSDRLEQDAVSASGTKDMSFNSMLLLVEKNAINIVGTSWDRLLDPELIYNVQRFRSYDPSSIRDLLRLIRNKFHHFDELPDTFKEMVGSKAEDLSQYFAMKFPRLLLHTFYFCQSVYPIDDILPVKYVIPSIRISPKTRNNSTIDNKPSVVIGCQSEEIDLKMNESKSNYGDAILLVDDPGMKPLNSSFVIPDNISEDDVSEYVVPTAVDTVCPTEQDDIIIWVGSTSAKTFQCRGWNRSDDEWQHQSDIISRRRDGNLIRCGEDNKYRTRLCNHWDESLGTFCPMRKKNKCIFAHGPIELRVKDAKRNRWGKLVDENGDCNNERHSGGEDTYGAARSIENERKQEAKSGKKSANGAKNKIAVISKKKSQKATLD